ncbi:phosphatidate cytidylyltransferase [Prevotella sp. AGR2160]|uniref:phosphatidate cytidylyltransferase n=1 Tax=Prevotella sp. AGR2160 TaxID=1280674 RepID=UPI000420E7F7|nr:phosphatidate cytidylyltransferase [Prevotella sp. AGR2160]
MSDKMKNLVVRAITGALFVIVMVGGFLWSPLSMIVLFAIITGMTIWEYTGLVNAKEGVAINRFITTLAGVYLFLATAGWRMGLTSDFIVFIPYILTIVYLFISELYLKQQDPVNDWAYTMLSQMYIALPFSLINILAFHVGSTDAMGYPGGMMVDYDSLLPLSIFIFLWTNDTGAYCSGSLFGKHKLFPRISPGKSWEGSIGGGILVLLVAALIGYLANNGDNQHLLNMPQWIGLGLVVVFFGTWGDLVESLFKRTLGIKDSGKILPGHGGMLDRFDSSLLAIPAAVIYLYTLTI